MVSIAILVLVVSFSYAYIKLEKQEKETNLLGTDCIKLEMEEVTDALTLTKTYPMTDKNGEKTEPFTFKLRNDCGVGIDYQINLRVEQTDNPMEAEDNIATKIDNKDKVVLSSDNKIENREPKEYKISKDNLTIQPYGEVEHNVRIWLDKDAGNDTQNKTFKSRIVIEATQNQIVEKYYKEAILHGADPVLNNTSEEPVAMLTASGETTADTLVPVIIDEETVKVRKADITQEWYNYETKKWANAVILVDNTKANEIQPGQEITEDQIESYFVWIPKYRYKIFDMGEYPDVSGQLDENAVQQIEIEFGTTNTEDTETSCKTPNKSDDNGKCEEGMWMTHPAFTAFSNSTGMWVGKFETGYKQSDNLSNIKDWNMLGAEHDEVAIDKIIIKPNVYSWRNMEANNMYQNSFDYQRELDSHLMKNTEWGAVAYLSHSKYGTCDNTKCAEVRINNSSNYVTGVAAQKDAVEYYNQYKDYGEVVPGNDANGTGEYNGAYNYMNNASKVASTTGNYTGIYDMSGGAWENMAVGIESENGNRTLSWDVIVKDEKYYDVYTYSASYKNWNRRILGDATGEMGPFIQSDNTAQDYVNSWNGKIAFLPTSNQPYSMRGGRFMLGRACGIFGFNASAISKNNYLSFRIVLTPTNEAM